MQEQQRLSRQEKNERKYAKIKEKNKRLRKKIIKRVKSKVKELDAETKEKYEKIKQEAEQKQIEALNNGIPIFIDLEYDILMNDREIRSLALQVSHLMGMNKTLKRGVQIHLTNVTGQQKRELEKQGLSKWQIHHYEEGLQELVESGKFGKEFVYLSPDAEEYLDDVDPDKYIYIVGGFVDRQVQKYMSLNKANSLQLCSRKLPIEQYIQGNKRPLNIDRVIGILSLFVECRNWEQAYNESGLFNVGLVERLRRDGQ